MRPAEQVKLTKFSTIFYDKSLLSTVDYVTWLLFLWLITY